VSPFMFCIVIAPIVAGSYGEFQVSGCRLQVAGCRFFPDTASAVSKGTLNIEH